MRGLRAMLANPRNRGRVLVGAAAAALLFALMLRRGRPAEAGAEYAAVGPLYGTGVGGGGYYDPGIGTPSDGVPTESFPPITVPEFPAAEPAPWGVEDLVGGVLGALPVWVTDPNPPSTTAPAPEPEPDKAESTPTPPKTSSGFWWNVGGRTTWITTANRNRFFAELRSKGADLSVWAARHPDAARGIGVTPPPTQPPPRASASAPVNQSPTSSIAKSSAPVAAPARPAPAAQQPAPSRRPSAPSRYYTYAPGKAPAHRKGDEAPRTGTLRYTAGKGYWIG